MLPFHAFQTTYRHSGLRNIMPVFSQGLIHCLEELPIHKRNRKIDSSWLLWNSDFLLFRNLKKKIKALGKEYRVFHRWERMSRNREWGKEVIARESRSVYCFIKIHVQCYRKVGSMSFVSP